MKGLPPRFQDRRHDARSLALLVLLDVTAHAAYVQELLDRHLAPGEAGADLSPQDRRLATHLVYTCLRRRGTLQALVEPLVSRAPENVEPWLWEVLRLGACQLLLVRNIPPHAALHETVELAARFGRPGAKGFLNGVLRNLNGLLTADETDTPGPDAVPLEGGRYRRLARPVLPEPGSKPVEYLSQGFALPRWLVQRWLERCGEEEVRRLGFWFAGPAPLILRVNPLRTSRDELLSALTAAGLSAEAGSHPQAVLLRDHAPVRELPGYAEGWFTVQDESAMRVGSALAPQPGWRVLDLCAAPGGKATHLAELMEDRGTVLATDLDTIRLGLVGESARRLGMSCVQTAFMQGEEPPEGMFDAVLVDAPCSNTGVLGRRPEIRWRLWPRDLEELSGVQARLLQRALSRVKPGGVAVYATCSIEPEENGALVRKAIEERGDVSLEAEENATPGQPADGGYWARLRIRSN